MAPCNQKILTKKEIKYEISDFLYHAMVLMVERVTWEEITVNLPEGNPCLQNIPREN